MTSSGTYQLPGRVFARGWVTIQYWFCSVRRKGWGSHMDAGLIDAVMAPVVTALGTIGGKALTVVEDEAADETVRLGRRLLGRLRRGAEDGGGGGRPQLEAAAADVAADPQDPDFQAALRGQVKKALGGIDGVEDPDLAADLAGLLAAAGVAVTASGERAVAVARNEGVIATGDNATITQHRR